MFKCLVPSWWNYLGRIERCGFTGGGVLLEVGFKDSKSMLFPIGTPSPPLYLYNYFQSENIFITLLFLNDLKNLMMT